MGAGTKTRILDAAERLFADRGYASTSLRTITKAAGVNLAAVHYHYHSKDVLLEQVIDRRASEVNKMRLDMLDRFRQEAGGQPVALEKIMEAFLAPAFHMLRTYPKIGLRFNKLMGRLHAEGDLPHQIMTRRFGPIVNVFHDALQESLPALSGTELAWRTHFMIGAMAHTLRWGQQIEIAPGRGPLLFDSDLVPRLVAFLCAGFRVRPEAPRRGRALKVKS
jgi:AcrR family transcriptional regulator